jgi:hypothetical protein
MAEPRIVLPDIVAEKSTCRITGALVDEAGVALGSSQLSTLTLTLYALIDTLPIINTNTDKNILNANQGTIDAGGLFTLTLAPADNVIIATGQTDETHRALLKWTWAAGAKAGLLEIDFRVRNFEKVT